MVTLPSQYTRRSYNEEEVIISICNRCFAVVAESSYEDELERQESQHRCIEKEKAFAA